MKVQVRATIKYTNRVGELIKELKTLPQDAEIASFHNYVGDVGTLDVYWEEER